MVATMIRGGEQEEHLVRNLLCSDITKFPTWYVGLQLALRPLTKAQWQTSIIVHGDGCSTQNLDRRQVYQVWTTSSGLYLLHVLARGRYIITQCPSMCGGKRDLDLNIEKPRLHNTIEE
jgi:hypothetical protein